MKILTQEEFEKETQARKKELKLLDWTELASVHYPTYFTATFTYFATGEGLSYGVAMGVAYSIENIRQAVIEHFGEFHGRNAEIALGLVLLPTCKELVPKATRQLIREIKQGKSPSYFRFHVVQHSNYG